MLDRPPSGPASRSWLWVFLLTLSIYVGIFFARVLQRFVEQHCGRAAFLVIVFVSFGVAACFAFRSVLRRPWPGQSRRRSSVLSLLGVGAAYTAGAWYLRRAPEEALHFVEYGAVSFLLFRAYSHRIRDPLVYLAATCMGGFLGSLDEVIQYFAPRRYFDFRDMGLNIAAVVLMQLAIAFGLRPAFIRPPVRAASVRTTCRLAFAWAVVLFCCFFNTLQRQSWFLQNVRHPEFMDRLNDMMVEYGYRFVAPDGAAFFTRLTLEEIRRQDATNGPGTASRLDRYQGTNGYARFLVDISRLDDPLTYEARIHLFRRDKYTDEAVKLRRDPMRARYAATMALRENQLIEWLYPNTLAHSQYAWRPVWREIVEKLADRDAPYESPVSNQLFTRFTERQIQSVLMAVMLVAVGLHVYYRRRE